MIMITPAAQPGVVAGRAGQAPGCVLPYGARSFPASVHTTTTTRHAAPAMLPAHTCHGHSAPQQRGARPARCACHAMPCRTPARCQRARMTLHLPASMQPAAHHHHYITIASIHASTPHTLASSHSLFHPQHGSACACIHDAYTQHLPPHTSPLTPPPSKPPSHTPRPCWTATPSCVRSGAWRTSRSP